MSTTLFPAIRRTGWAALAAGALILLSGCTAGGAQPGDGSSGDAKPTNQAEIKSGTYEQEMAKWQADLTACLKKKGVELPPQPTAKGGSGTGTELAAIDPGTVDLDALSAASRECTKTIGQPPINPDKSGRKELEALQKKQVIFAKCMRDAGYNFPDPEPLPDEENGAMSGSVAAPVRPGDYDEKTMKDCGAKAGFDQKDAN